MLPYKCEGQNSRITHGVAEGLVIEMPSITECSLNIVFFPRIFNILCHLSKDRAAIGCTEIGQPIRVTVHSDLSSDESISYMEGMGCSKFEKNTIFNEHLVVAFEVLRYDFDGDLQFYLFLTH